jgi:hypothetical protein
MVLRGLTIADDAATWSALGFAVSGDETVVIGGVAIRLAGAGAGEGIVGWSVEGLDGDVLPSTPSPAPPLAAPAHPNGVVAVDHVVAVTPDLDATLAALAGAGLEPRRVREVPGGDVRQAFYVLGTALLELAGPMAGEAAPRFWGLTLVAADLDALARRLGDRLGAPRDAVQPGRRIATLGREAGSSVPLAFMTPRPLAGTGG